VIWFADLCRTVHDREQLHELERLLVPHTRLPHEVEGPLKSQLLPKAPVRCLLVALAGVEIGGHRGAPSLRVPLPSWRQPLEQEVVVVEDEDVHRPEVRTDPQDLSARERTDRVVLGIDGVDRGCHRRGRQDSEGLARPYSPRRICGGPRSLGYDRGAHATRGLGRNPKGLGLERSR
jgi:hypothetical protein